MHSNTKRANKVEADQYNISSSLVFPEPWRQTTGYKPFTQTMEGNESDSSSLEQSLEVQSQSDGGMNDEDDDANKESRAIAPHHSDGNFAGENFNFQHASSTVPMSNNGNLIQHSQLELVGHSIQACGSNPYSDPYYGGMMATYGQPLVHPHLFDMHHARMPLPLEMAQEPVYVNAKQYHGILRRRQSRAKAEIEKKLIKARKPYLHESRHKHAMRRARASGGRFAKKSEVGDTGKQSAVTGSGSGKA